MVTGGGLHGSSDMWVSRVYYDRDALMGAWRKAVIALLRAALRAGQLSTKLTVDQMEEMLTQQEKRWWSIRIQNLNSLRVVRFEDAIAELSCLRPAPQQASSGRHYRS